MTVDEMIAAIERLDAEREAIYRDDKVTDAEHPRLREIEHELDRLWDLRRRTEAAKRAGLDHIPVPPPPNPSDLIG